MCARTSIPHRIWQRPQLHRRDRRCAPRQAVRNGCIVKEAITEIGVLRAIGDEHVEDIGIEGPLSKALRIGEAENTIPRPRPRLKFRIEQLTLIVATVGDAGWRLYPKQHGRFGPRGAVVVEPVLAEQGHVADARVIAAIKNFRRFGRVLDLCLADAGAPDPWQAHGDRQVVGDAVGVGHRHALDGLDAVVVGARELCAGNQGRITQSPEVDELVHRPKGALALVEGRRRDGIEGAGATSPRNCSWMMSVGRLGEQYCPTYRRQGEPGWHDGFLLSEMSVGRCSATRKRNSKYEDARQTTATAGGPRAE